MFVKSTWQCGRCTLLPGVEKPACRHRLARASGRVEPWPMQFRAWGLGLFWVVGKEFFSRSL